MFWNPLQGCSQKDWPFYHPKHFGDLMFFAILVCFSVWTRRPTALVWGSPQDNGVDRVLGRSLSFSARALSAPFSCGVFLQNRDWQNHLTSQPKHRMRAELWGQIWEDPCEKRYQLLIPQNGRIRSSSWYPKVPFKILHDSSKWSNAALCSQGPFSVTCSWN